MKHILVLLFVFGGCSLTHAQSEKKTSDTLAWHTDIVQAHTLSEATQKPIFAFFTGSDWCGWCKKLQQEVFAKPAFISWANENVILLELDFPRRKELPAALVQQNQSLQSFFNVGGFPTIWMFFMNKDAANAKFVISPLGSLGYPRNPEAGKEEIKFLEDATRVLNTPIGGK
jgi:thiol-disulfide isomerase/thioredoxin